MTKLFVLEYSDTSYIVVNDILITNVYAEDFDMGMSLETFTGTLKATLNAAGVSTVMVKLDANPFFAEHLGSEPDAEGEFLAEWLRENPGQLEAKVLLAQSEFRQRLCLEAEALCGWTHARTWLEQKHPDLDGWSACPRLGQTPLEYAWNDERVDELLHMLEETL